MPEPITDSARQVPDPSVVTAQRITENIQFLDEKFHAHLSGVDERLVGRIQSLEKEVANSHQDLVRVPTAVDRAIQQLRELVESKIATLDRLEVAAREQRTLLLDQIQAANSNLRILHDEKFLSIKETIRVLTETINDRFTQNDQNTEKAFNAAKTAVSERDASNKESANKSEKNLMDAIGKLDDNVKTLSVTTSNQIALNKNTMDDKINDIKDRMATFESRLTGNESAKKGGDDKSAVMYAAIATIITIALSAIYIGIILIRH
jgi:acetyl/propionyl-CoA carboxylase alpha subunit